MGKLLTYGPEDNRWRGRCPLKQRAVGVGGRFPWQAKRRGRLRRSYRAFTVTFATNGIAEEHDPVMMAPVSWAKVAQGKLRVE